MEHTFKTNEHKELHADQAETEKAINNCIIIIINCLIQSF